MNIVPGRSPQQWASFNSRFRLILSPVVSALCFAVVVFGSVYGFQKMIEPQFPGLGIWIALVIAFTVQRLNAVCVHFSTRMIASAFIPRDEKRTLENQRVAGVDITVGMLCLCLTAGICAVDFIANREGNHAAIEQYTAKPEEKRVDMAPHERILDIATQARNAEKAAEARERDAWNAKVDAEINRERRRLEARKRHLAPLNENWAKVESKRIESTLTSIETRRKERKSEFQPKTSNLAAKEKELADIAAKQSSMLQDAQGAVQADNSRVFSEYEQRKESRKGGLFLIYLAAMLLWHICHGMKQYRALKFDEKHPDRESPLLAIFGTIGNGLENALWTIRAKIYDWLPEDEIRDASKKDLLKQIHSDVCQDVFHFVASHQGVNEMGIYLAMKHHDLNAVRQSLKVLKTVRLLFENSGMWTADKTQAALMLDDGTNLTGLSDAAAGAVPFR